MASRLELQDKLLAFCPNVYFQPPSSVKMEYPCIVYNMTSRMKRYASDVMHFSMQEYRLTVIDKNPDSEIAVSIERSLPYCGIDNYFTSDNLNHTVLSLFF